MRVLKSNIDKSVVAEMPLTAFTGRIIVVQSASEAEKAVDYLSRQPIVGIDTETRPAFQKGQKYGVALLQISTPDTCFLFRLNMIGFPPSLRQLIHAEVPVKVGLSLRDDFQRLHRMGSFEQGGYVELQDYATRMGIEAQSLLKIFAILFGQKISKAQRLSNWEADVLTDAQKLYAATDAWACLKIYDEMEALSASGDYIIEKEDEQNSSSEER